MAKSKAQQAAIAISMKAAGKTPKKMAMGGMNDDKGKGKVKPTKETKDSKIMWEKTKKSLAARPGGAEMIRREQAARDSLMKAGKPVPGSMKKGGMVKKQKGGPADQRRKADTFTQDDKGNYNYVGKYNTPSGTRYYSGSSPDQGTAMKMAGFKARTSSSDSIPSSLIKPMKKGGAVPKGYHRMPNGKIMKNSAHKTKKK